ncbi:iap-like protein [Heliothis virescens ascovirus 3g]|uniref:Iap-like protein n=1 Tax=Heliothis virescens ascovirus 3g TaxID=1246651 RepID=K4NVI9_9VIRU|nr:iap-like protein [Heliothis virescens ascovirus 3g]AFV50321.1 iap-like protein [Heliothis virescens ascovirus 3g]
MEGYMPTPPHRNHHYNNNVNRYHTGQFSAADFARRRLNFDMPPPTRGRQTAATSSVMYQYTTDSEPRQEEPVKFGIYCSRAMYADELEHLNAQHSAYNFNEDSDDDESDRSVSVRHLSSDFMLDLFKFDLNTLHPYLYLIREQLKILVRRPEIIVSDRTCVVCFEPYHTSYGRVSLPCRHSVLCDTCSIDSRIANKCPFCRTTVKAIMFVHPNISHLSSIEQKITCTTKL